MHWCCENSKDVEFTIFINRFEFYTMQYNETLQSVLYDVFVLSL